MVTINDRLASPTPRWAMVGSAAASGRAKDELPRLRMLTRLSDAARRYYAEACEQGGVFRGANPEAVVGVWLKAAKQGDGQAQTLMGLSSHLGYGVRCDRKAARKWLEKAAAQGERVARAVVRRMYPRRKGRPAKRGRPVRPSVPTARTRSGFAAARNGVRRLIRATRHMKA